MTGKESTMAVEQLAAVGITAVAEQQTESVGRLFGRDPHDFWRVVARQDDYSWVFLELELVRAFTNGAIAGMRFMRKDTK